MSEKAKSFNAISDGLDGFEDNNNNEKEIELLRAAKEKAEMEARKAKKEAEKAKIEAEEAKKKAGKETRSRHVQILMTPSLYDLVKKKANDNDISINEFINRTLEKEIQ